MFCSTLTEKQIEKIHEISLDILEQIGVMIPHKEMLSRFSNSGAEVDHQKELVKIPPELVMDLLNKAGKQFTLYGRNLTKTAKFGQGTRNYNSVAGEALWIDNPGKQRRYPSLEDVKTAARFNDALECINIAGAMADPHELSGAWRCVNVLAEMIKNTTKPITCWFHNRASAEFMVELLIALRGSGKEAVRYPLCYPFLEPISPLRFPFDGIDLLFETSKINLPVPVGPMAQMGISAPCTITDTLAQENAEILAGICITQLIKPGLPVCYGGICHAFDMATTQMIFAGPEQAIFSVAMTQMGKYYALPVYINAGLTDAKYPDAQAGLEAGITLAMGAAAGADIFGHMGICGVDQAASLDFLVMQHEIIAYIESMMRTIDYLPHSSGLDILKKLGPGGNFIDTIHTAEHFRKELWFPAMLDRHYYQHWLDNGAATMQKKCADCKEKILRSHTVEPVPEDIEKELDKIVLSAQKELQM